MGSCFKGDTGAWGVGGELWTGWMLWLGVYCWFWKDGCYLVLVIVYADGIPRKFSP